MYAALSIRGNIKTRPKIKKTMELLNLTKVNHLSLWKEEPSVEKMLNSVSGYITYGKINEEMLKELLEKRGNFEEGSDAKKAFEALKNGKSMKEAGVKNCFRLSPPKKGFERGGIKKPYPLGGVLGNRGEEINSLVKKMI